MKLDDDDFTLFGLPPHFALDGEELATRWRALQAQVHPDRHAAAGAAAQRVAMQWATRVNEGYRRLQDPLRRAAYLCELRGVAIDAERNTAMPRDFLLEQMAWREALDAAGDDRSAVEAIDADVGRDEAARLAAVGSLLDGAGAGAAAVDVPAAAAQVRALMFVRRFRADLAQRLDALESAC
ncbi:MAG: Fe-S protein assembly co-chaperone HscB [Rubrivivax sp.]